MIQRIFTLMLISFGCCFVYAEQKVMLDGHEVHYIVLPTTFLKPKVASQYNLARGKDRALVNISVLDPDGTPVEATVTGSSKNLLGQIQTLEFTLVSEPPAIYYLAQLRHGDEEHHRISLHVTLANGAHTEIKLQQKMYWKH